MDMAKSNDDTAATRGGPTQPWRRLAHMMTARLFAACFITAMLNMLFGFDVTSFAGVQSIPGFTREFGSKQPDGSYRLSSGKVSFMSSIGFAGKFFGTLTAPLYIERIGHRLTIFTLITITTVGVVIECTASSVAQFVVGRIIVYYSVGIAENVSTTYQSEVVPASLRGAVVGSIQLFIQHGQIMAAGVNENFSSNETRAGWIIPVAIQAAVPVIIFPCAFFIPLGPRWLLSKHRKDEAIETLRKIRPKKDIAEGHHIAEADAIEEALKNRMDKGPWLDLFRGTNLRRTEIAVVVFIFHQFTGQGFVSQYSPRFYKSVGLGENAFKYNIASATVAWAGVVAGMCLFDTVGRRNMLIVGCVLQAVFLFSLAGIGLIPDPSASQTNGLVASIMMFQFFYHGSLAPIGYVIGSEIGTGPLREKTMAFSSTVNVVAAWLVAFVVPYLIEDISANIGWIFGGFSILATVYVYWRVPEISGRSLEELDELFENRVPARKFGTAETHGAARRVAEIEGRRPVVKGDGMDEGVVESRREGC